MTLDAYRHRNLEDEMLHVPAIVSGSDPGAIGAGKGWVDTSGGTGAWVLKIRNAADTDWEEVGGGGVTDHGALSGLADDDHPQYLTAAEGAAAFEATGAVSTHAAAGDPHTGYRLESADHTHASSGAQAGQVAHSALTGLTSGAHTPPQVNSYTANDTWTKPAGAQKVWVRAVGGGGGSGGTAATGSGTRAASGAGGGGGYVEKWYAAGDLDATESVVVGAAGSAGSAGNNNGGAGGNSTFADGADLITAAGGGGGTGGAATSTASTADGGAGGVGSGGDVNGSGQPGDSGRIIAGPATLPIANGGSSIWGGGGLCGSGASGTAGTGKGGGGGGTTGNASDSARAGAAGSAGQVIVVTFF